MKEAWIDVLSEDKDIAFNLGETLHQALDERPKGEVDTDLEILDPCFPFLCRSDPMYTAVKNLVKSFEIKVLAQEMKPATLLFFSTESHSDPKAYLLGVMLKKPCMQILVEADVIEDAAHGISEIQWCASTGIPKFRYSHEIFNEFCKGNLSSTLVDLTVTVEAWTCEAFFGEQRQIKIRSGILISEFEVTVRKPVTKKPLNVKLPFGLSVPKGKKVRKDYKAKKSVAKQKKVQQSESPMPGIGIAAESCEAELDSDSNAFSEDSEGEVEVEQEAEHVVPASSTVAQEELQLVELKREMEAVDSIREKAAERARFLPKNLALTLEALLLLAVRYV